MNTSTNLRKNSQTLLDLAAKFQKIETALENLQQVIEEVFPEETPIKKGIEGIVRAETMKVVERGDGVAETTVKEWKTA
jgi:prefoldin subunit 5